MKLPSFTIIGSYLSIDISFMLNTYTIPASQSSNKFDDFPSDKWERELNIYSLYFLIS